MANTNHNSSRKPSGSSTHSAAHSNLNSPSGQPLRDLAPSPRYVSVGTASTGARKSTNPGWPMWNNKPTSRNVSASSATSLPDSITIGQGSGFRTAREDAWTATRNSGNSWNEMGNSSQRTDISLDQQSYQRQATAASTALDVPSAGQYASQRYGALDSSATSRFNPNAGRNSSYSGSQGGYNVQQQLPQSNNSGPTFPTIDSAVIEEDLTSAMRGMTVEEDYSYSQQAASNRPSGHNTHVAAHQQLPTQVISQGQQGRPAFAAFPQPDYPAYYPNSYPYDAYRQAADPNLYAASPVLSAATPASTIYHGGSIHGHADVHSGQQAAALYDFQGLARAHSQFYYTSPAMMYHPAHARPALPTVQGQADISRELQFGVQNLAFANMPPSPAQHQTFNMNAIDYSRQLSHLVSPALFGHAMGMPMVHGHPHGQKGKRGNYRHHHHEDANVQRSVLLEEFRSDKSKTWELKNLIGHIVEFSRDQHGSRFIQTQLESANEEGRQLVYGEIVPAHTAQLIQDVFGNYVIQKLLEYGSLAERAQIVSAMEGNILTLSLHMYGCRVIQKAIELITPDQQSAFVNELDGSILKLVKDANGNHVIQKMIQAVAPERLPFVEAFKGHVHELATHPFGCRVLQRCLENMPAEHTRPLLDEMLEHTIDLMKDQFGNYVVQYVLEHGQSQDNKFIVTELQGHLLAMAQHKFASNVCEKALVTATSELRSALIDEIVAPKRESANVILMMMRDQYANYVLQRALSVVEGDQKEILVNKVRPQLIQLRKQSSHISKHLLAIDRLLEKCSPSQPETQSQESSTELANSLGSAAATAPSASQ